MFICELISNIYNYFYYSILRNSDSNLTEKLLEVENNLQYTKTLSQHIYNLKTNNKLYYLDEHV
jgi:hypothetical protein